MEVLTGRIIKSAGAVYEVGTGEGILQSRARGRFRLDGIVPVVGDLVDIRKAEGNTGSIVTIHSRKNILVRPSVANLDLLVIVASAAPPVTDMGLVDRLCALAELSEITPVICLNKTDLALDCLFLETYRRIGYDMITTSAETNTGITQLRQRIAGAVSAFAGNSGVGKSSILNSIDPSFGMRTGEISQKAGRGRHTTRHVELFLLPGGGYIADTPGFSMFDAVEMNIRDKSQLPYGFREFVPYFTKCRYRDCSHTAEEGCAVIDAVRTGEIAKTRHRSYCELFNEIKNIRDWM